MRWGEISIPSIVETKEEKCLLRLMVETTWLEEKRQTLTAMKVGGAYSSSVASDSAAAVTMPLIRKEVAIVMAVVDALLDGGMLMDVF